MKIIPVSQPALIGNEKKYVNECLKSTWISSKGKYIDLFEKAFADYLGIRYALSCTSGTTALHLALLALGIKKGDEVICPTFTYVATANSIRYVGATPVFADCESDTFNINPFKIEKLITKRTKAIIVVHIYGHPCDMDPILKIARKYNLYVIEDAAEALGSQYKGRKCGTLGDVAIFSFYGNKIITTGEGGMVVTNNKKIAERVKLLKGQGMDPKKRYWFPILGYNYRMTNIQAAIGLAQLENIEKFISKRRKIAKMYNYYLKGIDGLVLPAEKNYAYHSYWMYSILIEDEYRRGRDEVMKFLAKNGIETRPFFYPMHTMPVYKKINKNKDLKISEDIAVRGINLPTFYSLKKKDIKFISHQLIKFKVDEIKDKFNKKYIARKTESKDEKKLFSFFEIIKKCRLNRFFHPHSFNKQAVKKIISILGGNRKDLYFLVLNQKHQIAGYFMLRGFDEGYKIPSFGVVVHPNYTKRGLGTEITKLAIKICKRLKVRKLMVHVYKDNIIAKEIYKKLGFQFSQSKRKENELVGHLKLKQ